MLQRLHRALRFAEDRRDLAVREAEDELERQHLLLLVGEVLDQLEQALAADRVQRLHLGGVLLVADRLRHLLLGLHAARRAEVVHREVVRDPKEPGRERRRLKPELADRLEHPQEGLRGQVLGVVPVPDRHVQVAVDPVEVDQVQLFERRSVTLLPALDQPPDLRPRLLGPLRRAFRHSLRSARAAGLRN